MHRFGKCPRCDQRIAAQLATVSEALATMPEWARDAWLHGTATTRLTLTPTE